MALAKRKSNMRRRGPVALADLSLPVLASAARERGFASAELIAWWPEIVGPTLARVTQPDRLIWPRRAADPDRAREPATLELRIAAGFGLIVQQQAPQIIEKLNAFLGYPAVGRLKLVQRPLKRRPQPEPPRPATLPADEETKLKERLQAIEDDGLKDALARLGRGVLSRKLTKA